MSPPTPTGIRSRLESLDPADVAAAVLCVLIGLWIALLPHLIWWLRFGCPHWIASNDELIYLSVASQAYFNHPLYLSDAVRVSGGASVYPWLQLVPGIAVARGLGLGAPGILLVWRFMAGVTIGGGLFLFLRHFIRRPWLTAGLVCLLLVDSGFNWARPFFHQVLVLADLLRAPQAEWLFSSYPVLLLQWRVITPGLSLFYLLLHLWLIARAREQPTRPRILWAGASFGLLFHAYFYFWTAAGLGLLLAIAADWPHRKVYFHTGWIGGLLGLPAVLTNLWLTRTTNPDWPQRTALFIPIGHFSELWFPTGAILLTVLGFVWVRWRQPELRYLWAVATAGFLLMNQQIVTGLQVCNDHWGYVRGIGFSLLFVLLAVRELIGFKTLPRPLWALLLAAGAAHFATGVCFRVLECTLSRDTLAIQTAATQYREQRLRDLATPLQPNSVVGGDAAFVDLAQVFENQRPLERSSFLSTTVDNREWDVRAALNGFLRAQTPASFRAEQAAFFDSEPLGPWARKPSLRTDRVAHRLACFDAIQANPPEWFERFQLRYVGLPAAQLRPAYMNSSWTRIQDGPHWQIWERINE